MPVYGGTLEVEVVNEVQLVPNALLRDGAVESDGDLTIKVQSFFYDIAGIHGKYPGALAQAVVDDDTTFVYFDSSETLQVTNVGYTSGTHIRLARVIAQSGIIVRIIPERAFLSAAIPIPPWVNDSFTTTIGQVTFIISQAPTDFSSLTFSVNGVLAEETVDYSVSGTTITWLNTSYTMEATDKVVVRYR